MLGTHSDRPPLVLNVDDNEVARSAVSLLLRGVGFDVREAASGEQALLLLDDKPDLVLLDVNLGGGLDGLEICRRLKTEPATALLPVILISAISVSVEDRVRALEGGADGYLTKPIDPADLVAHIKALLRVRRAEQDRNRLQAQRDELLKRRQLHIERTPLAYVLFDPDLRVLDWNPAAERIFGFRREEVLGMGPPFEKIVPQAARAQAEEILRRLRSGDMSAHSVNDNLTKDGRTVTCEWFNTPLVGEDGRFDGLLCLAQDITERKVLEEQLRQSQKMEAVGQLAGGVAHDFNNLLCIINGYSDILFNALRPDDPLRDLVDEIRKAGERSASLTRQLLAFSRKQVIAPKVLDLNTVILDLEKMLRRAVGEDVELATKLAPNLGNVEADHGQVEQVLLNLVVNARDAMPQGGKLTIETRNVGLDEGYARSHPEVRPGPYVLLAVSDTGSGMTAEVKSHLFEPFFTTKEVGKGTGLGLATAYGIVRQGGGHIEVDSEPGVGASFRVYLPRVERPNLSGNPLAEAGAAPRGNETVLLVEDEGAVRAVNRHTLGRGGYTVLEAGDGKEALRVAARHRGPIHLLVTDVVMPGLGGRQLAEQLSALRPEMRVLYVSGYPDDAVVRHGILVGGVNFLQKPFLPAVLAGKVRDVLDSPGQG